MALNTTSHLASQPVPVGTTCCILLSVALPCGCDHQPTRRPLKDASLHVRVEDSTNPTNAWRDVRLVRNGAEFVSTTGDERLPQDSVGRIREIALNRTPRRANIPALLAVDCEDMRTLHQKVARVLYDDTVYAHYFTADARQDAVATILDCRRLGEVLQTATLVWSGHGVSAQIALPGTPTVTLTHDGGSELFVPWVVTVDSLSWNVVDPTLTMELFPVLRPNERWSTWTSDWLERTFNDRTSWAGCHSEVDSILCREAYQCLPGYQDARASWSVRSAYCANGPNETRDFMCLQLRSRAEDLVRAAEVVIPFAGDKLSSDWNAVTDALRQRQSAVQNRSWIVDWLASDSDRYIELNRVGIGPLAGEAVESAVVDLWRNLRFPSGPDFSLLLRSDGEVAATVVLSLQGKYGIVTQSRGIGGSHPIDKVAFMFSTREPTYLFADTNGNLHRENWTAAKR